MAACLASQEGGAREQEHFTEQHIIAFLKQAEAGVPVNVLWRKHGSCDAAFCAWRRKFGGLQVNEATRLLSSRLRMRT
jgi:putative transposase